MTLEADGLVNKVSMFDKDMMILIVFGLRGLSHEDEAQHALLCAFMLKDRIVDENIISVSIGVTSGKLSSSTTKYRLVFICVNVHAPVSATYTLPVIAAMLSAHLAVGVGQLTLFLLWSGRHWVKAFLHVPPISERRSINLGESISAVLTLGDVLLLLRRQLLHAQSKQVTNACDNYAFPGYRPFAFKSRFFVEYFKSVQGRLIVELLVTNCEENTLLLDLQSIRYLASYVWYI